MTSITNLSSVWQNSTNETASLVSASGLSGNYQADDISLLQACNVVGSNASIPNVNVNITPDFALSVLESLDNDFGGGTPPSLTVSRVMRVLTLGEHDAYCNSFYINYDGNYVLTSFMNGTTTVYKNGTSAGTITSARGTLSLTSLVVGDRISFDKPCNLHKTVNPGTQGIYNGYCGYSFANRIDRYTVTFYIFNMSTTDAIKYEVKLTATNNANVTSMSDVANGTISAGSFATIGPTATQGNYFIIANGLVCCTRGQFPSNDVLMLYPLTMDPKYGFFSGNGHTLAVNNAFVEESNSGGGDDIKGRASDAGSADIITSLGTGRDNVFASNAAPADLKAGNYYSGEACVVYADPGPTSGEGTLFVAEGQGDGNGGEMTAFTATAAHSYACISGAGSAWVAFVRAGNQGEPSYSNYNPVILHYNSSDEFIEAISFNEGSATYPPISKAYIGNGSGTGTFANAGDYFYCTHPMQAFHDTDASDKDESNMIMSNEIFLVGLNLLNFMGSTESAGYASAALACSNGASGEQINIYCTGEEMAEGQVLSESDTTGNTFTPFNGENEFFRYIPAGSRTAYSVQVGYNGIIIAFSAC